MRPGVFSSEIVAIGLTSSNAGTPGVWVTVAVEDEFGGAAEEMTGKIWLTDKAMGMAKKQFKAIGFDYKTKDLNWDNLQACIGNGVDVTLKEEEYKNRKEVKVSMFGAANQPPSPESVEAAMKKLRATKDDQEGLQDAPESTRGKKADSGRKEVATPPPVADPEPTVAEPPASASEEDDGIPF